MIFGDFYLILALSVPIPSTAIFLVMALSWGWLSDGPLQGARWPFIYAGAILIVSRYPEQKAWVSILIPGSQTDHLQHPSLEHATLLQCRWKKGCLLAQ
jgi:hypothetical protein